MNALEVYLSRRADDGAGLASEGGGRMDSPPAGVGWHRHPDGSWVWGVRADDGCALCDQAVRALDGELHAEPVRSGVAKPKLEPPTSAKPKLVFGKRPS